MKQCIKVKCALFALLIFCAACEKSVSSLPPSKKEQHAKTVTLYVPSLPKTLDPRKIQTLSDQTLVSMLMEGLTRIDQTGNNPLALSEKVKISLDQKTYTFTLRKSKWSNGEPLTSYDFAHAWKTSLSPHFHASNAEALYVIKNAEEAKRGKLPISLVGIETPDANTLVVILNNPTPSFLKALSHPIFFPVNKKVDKNNPKWAEAHATYVGNGPFVLHAEKDNDKLEVKKNQGYWDEKAVKLTKIQILPADLKDKCVSCSQAVYSKKGPKKGPLEPFKSANDRRLSLFPREWVVVNGRKGPLENKNFRKALAFAIAPQGILNPLKKGHPISSKEEISIPTQSSITTQFNRENIDRAETFFKAALSELGFPPKQGPHLSLLYPSDQTHDFLAQNLQNQWKSLLGIDVQLHGVEEQEFLDRLSKNDYSLYLGDWTTGFKNSSFQSQLSPEDPCLSNVFFVPLSYFRLFDSKDQILQGLVVSTAGHIDFKWAYLN